MIEVDDINIYPCAETTKDFVFLMNENMFVIHKKGGWEMGDTRFLINNSYLYENVGFDVKDGVAVSNGIENVNRCNSENPSHSFEFNVPCEDRIHDVITAHFPTIREIFSNQELFDIAWSYMNEIGVGFTDWLKNGGDDLTPFFEGFFFNGGVYIKYDVKHTETLYEQIEKRFFDGEDVPKNFFIERLGEVITDKKNHLVGEVGLCGSNEHGVEISAFFPNKVEPSVSYDIPIKELPTNDLQEILKVMSKKNSVVSHE